mmetsp:Transcript_60996/g.98756  ORF Transcript_60996/g.98756 Transcript_60996/m.98756 type:complete len:146 (-) Transcript_60996:421-858(-)
MVLISFDSPDTSEPEILALADTLSCIAELKAEFIERRPEVHYANLVVESEGDPLSSDDEVSPSQIYHIRVFSQRDVVTRQGDSMKFSLNEDSAVIGKDVGTINTSSGDEEHHKPRDGAEIRSIGIASSAGFAAAVATFCAVEIDE